MTKKTKVEIRKKSKYSTKYIVWNTAINQIFANEYFNSENEAKAFITQNKLKLA